VEPVAIAKNLARDLESLRFRDPVACVYNPLIYAFASHRQYLERFGSGRREIVLLGMNPGPWGMVQTGVPFGDPSIVREWFRIDAKIDKPRRAHPKRPVIGLTSTRNEVSGTRLWGWARDRFGEPQHFFTRFVVVNYCPLAFFDDAGRNLTPDKFAKKDSARLFEACDHALRLHVEHYRPDWVIGIGAFAEGRARAALDGMEVRIGRVLHPSPASPIANRGWAEQAEQDLQRLGIRIET